jgi:hypothetical protein
MHEKKKGGPAPELLANQWEVPYPEERRSKFLLNVHTCRRNCTMLHPSSPQFGLIHLSSFIKSTYEIQKVS